MSARVFLITALLALTLHADDFAIRDGDTVVFLGDSITATRTYGKVIENYTLLRYPERKAHFHNAGWGGLARLERDVFSRGATLVTVAYGMNDIGWGMKADDEHKQKYLDSVRGIVEACKARNIRAFICSAAITAVLHLTNARNELDLSRLMTRLYSPRLEDDPQYQRDIAALNACLENQRHTAARPASYHFIIKPTEK